jgi:hypothetical protein
MQLRMQKGMVQESFFAGSEIDSNSHAYVLVSFMLNFQFIQNLRAIHNCSALAQCLGRNVSCTAENTGCFLNNSSSEQPLSPNPLNSRLQEIIIFKSLISQYEQNSSNILDK